MPIHTSVLSTFEAREKKKRGKMTKMRGDKVYWGVKREERDAEHCQRGKDNNVEHIPFTASVGVGSEHFFEQREFAMASLFLPPFPKAGPELVVVMLAAVLLPSAGVLVLFGCGKVGRGGCCYGFLCSVDVSLHLVLVVMLGFVKFGQGRLRQIKIKVKFQLSQVLSNFDMCLGDKASLAPLFVVVVFFPFGCSGCCFGSR